HYDHVDFKCTACQHTYCLHRVAIPPAISSSQFQAERSDYTNAGSVQPLLEHGLFGRAVEVQQFESLITPARRAGQNLRTFFYCNKA
ncbi:MAG TPA: hypothetical protein VK364_11865, partial [Hymenobacter sp.]|nr:hypothetical protein [Hymenobacter sp.]